ncbi:MAG: succinyldiaminopimelate transaminase [Pseudomonadales bacterium]
MNPHIESLQLYPFERLQALKTGIRPNPDFPEVMLSIGEPKHAPPSFVIDVLADRDRLQADLAAYPATRGSDALRAAIAEWARRRYGATLDPATQVLPVAGTREALFSFAQTTLSGAAGSLAVLPNPFYQIYEGAVLLRGALPYFVPCGANTGYRPDYRSVPDQVWQRCELLFLCSPNNPTGTTLGLEELTWLLELAERHDFVIAADECYAEIYFDDAHPPVGLLEACVRSGRTDYRNCVVFHSLSKRSNLPGLRSGFVAGDARVLASYYKYRTYEGCALPNQVQAASVAAWQDEQHVIANRSAYRAKFEALTPILARAFDVQAPEGGFYHWLPTPGDDAEFARDLYAARSITVLPGSYLARSFQGFNPGSNHVRVAWVAPLADCVRAAEALVSWLGER